MSKSGNNYVSIQLGECKCFTKSIKIEQDSISGHKVFAYFKEHFNFASPFRWSVATRRTTDKIWSRVINIRKFDFTKNITLRYDGLGKKWSSSETMIFVPDPESNNPRKWSTCVCKENAPCRQNDGFCSTHS